MARIRSVKPELRESKVVGSWPMEVRYFWVLLWGYLDDFGRGLDLPKRIAGDCFPLDTDDYDSRDVDAWLDLMTKGVDEQAGPVCRYEVSGTRYVHATNWREHQKPNRPTPSRLPPCPLHESLTERFSEPLNGDGLSTDTRRPSIRNNSASGQVNRLTEGLTESLNGNSVPGAGEQGSRGAGEQQQRAHESRSESPSGARGIVIDATGATEAEADQLIARVKRERQPRALVPFVRRMVDDGDLAEWLAELRGTTPNPDREAAFQAIRDGPACEHGQAGGALPHPDSGEPICALCRRKARLRVVEPEAS